MGNSKKVVFYYDDKRHADLKIRLHYDSLTQSDFFRGIVEGYLKKDVRIINFIDDLKEDLGKQSKKKREESGRQYKGGQLVKDRFGLNEDEIEDIFDMLEMENPEI